MELYYGAYKSQSKTSNLAKVRRIESIFEILPVDGGIEEGFGALKAGLESHGTPLDDFELVIAACALGHNLTLVTNNEKHFARIEGLHVENWARP
jgi:tRNA(fMet)-specific endonuclease VapC